MSEVVHETDVVVVGGGPAGVSAAVAASRNGAKVALIERYAQLGGLAGPGGRAARSRFGHTGSSLLSPGASLPEARALPGGPWHRTETATARSVADRRLNFCVQKTDMNGSQGARL